MGADARSRSPLHPHTATATTATTASSVRSLPPPSGDDGAAAPVAATDLATDVSRRTDKSHFSIPEDGTPVHINTKQVGRDYTASDQSQTSLLIEYFGGGKGPNDNSKPSVRVKVTPSSSKRAKEGGGRVRISEPVSDRHESSHTRHVSLGPAAAAGQTRILEDNRRSLDDGSSLSLRPRATYDPDLYRDSESEMTGTSLSNQNQYSDLNPSELSSMPPDSMVDGPAEEPVTPVHEIATTKANLAAPLERSRSVSKERLTRKVIEKLGHEGLATSSGKERSHKTRSRSVSKEHLEETTGASRRRSGKHRAKDDASGSSDPSLLTASQLSESRSVRSGASKSSINNNPKLLETVEDAIRRLILPELTALKLEQKTQKNRDKFERMRRESGSSLSRDELGRRLSKTSSDPNVHMRQKSVEEEDDIAAIKRRARGHVYDYPSEKGMSDETVIRDGEKPRRRRSKDSHRARDAALGATAGALAAGVLTRDALKHHDSQSSIERRERRRKRNKSHSRSHSRNDSLAESEDVFRKHDVPPMPMRSEITGSDLTRDSILSERTSTPTSERRRTEIRQVARGSPRGISSPNTGKREIDGPLLEQEHYYEDHGSYEDRTHEDDHRFRDVAGAGAAGLAVGAGAAALVNSGGVHYYDEYQHPYGHGHTLSPIQSVASLEEVTTEHPRDTQRSIDSLDSVEAANMRNDRPRGINLESPSEILAPHSFKASDNNLAIEEEQYRGSVDDSIGGSRRLKHLSTDTYDSMDPSYGDAVASAQQIRGIGANPEYIGTPLAVESAVASLYEPSVLEAQSIQSGRSRGTERAQSEPLGSEERFDGAEFGETDRRASTSNLGSPLKNQIMPDYEEEDEYEHELHSPRQSPAKDAAGVSRGFDEPIELSHSGVPDANDPMPAIGHFESKSEISTNPSIIQGPGGGLDKEISPWMFEQSRDKADSENGSGHDSLKAAAKNFLAAAAGATAGAALAGRGKELPQEENTYSKELPPGSYQDELFQGSAQKLPPDEGYETMAHAHSPSLTPDHRGKAPQLFSGEDLDDGFGLADPYAMGQPRTLTADSHGAASPLYDSATGNGLDRIQSKDIVALMNHLTVRDAQRNARDTEILVTIVQIATELRTSFADMRQFIQNQDDMIIEVGNKQHDRTQRVIGGPRPQPSSTRLQRGSSDDGGDERTKRRNIFRRALKNLSGKNNDISKLEDMLNHLLDEVADLKATQGVEPNQFQSKTTPTYALTNGLTSYEALRDGQQSGYEPEGRAGTNSNAENSGFFSNPSSQQTARPPGAGRRRTSENRISTVMEADEEAEAPLEPHEQDILDYENTDELMTPTRTRRNTAGNAPETPKAAAAPAAAPAQSVENTPQTDKSKKHHKSSSSSFFPKISRWSKTTASTVADNVRNSARRERPYSNVSHSGSDVQNYDITENYDPRGDDRLRSNTSVNQDRPPSPLVPSALSEKPTYRAHRESINLQHPQPRQGPTARYQNHLESQVQAQSMSPISPSSDQFGSNPVLARYSGPAGNRYSGGGASRLTPISDAGQSAASQTTPGPPRPPKIRDDGPLVPPKIPLEDEKKPTFAERSAPAAEYAEESGARRSVSGQTPPGRKPSGPRPIVSSGSYTPDRVAAQPRTRYRGSPNPIDSFDDLTF